MDKLDQILFELANEKTQKLPLDENWQAILSLREKKRKRNVLLIRYGSIAATIAVGLWLGSSFLRANIPSSPTPTATAPVATPFASPTPSQPTATQKPTGTLPPAPTLAASPEATPANTTTPKPKPTKTPEQEPTIPVEPVPTPYDDTSDDEIIIIVDPPKTDGPSKYNYGPEHQFANMTGITSMVVLRPTWLPYNMDAWELVYENEAGNIYSLNDVLAGNIDAGMLNHWCYSLGDDIVIFAWIVRDERSETLPVGSGQARTAINEDGSIDYDHSIDWEIQLDESTMLFVEFHNITYEDSLRILQSFPAPAARAARLDEIDLPEKNISEEGSLVEPEVPEDIALPPKLP